MDELKRQLQQIRSIDRMRPDQAWVQKTRADLLRHIAATSTETVKPAPHSFLHMSERMSGIFAIFVPQPIAAVVRPLATAVMVLAVAVSGWIASVSASYSIPGDVLYNVKIAAEKTQVAVATVTGADEWKAQLHMKFATERARETKEVVAKNIPESSEQATNAMESLNKSIVAASDSIKDVSDTEPEKAIELARDANTKTEEIVTTLNQVTKDTTLVGDIDLTKKVVETTKLVNETSISTVEAMVHKQTEEGTVAASEEVKDLVAKKINTILQEQKVTTEAIAQVQTVSSSTVSSTVLPIVVPIVSDTNKMTSSTVTSSVSVLVPTQTVEQAVQKANQTSAVAEGVVKEAKDLVDNNQIIEAIQKVKEANQATQEAKQAVVEAQKIVKDTVPAAVVPAALLVETKTTTTLKVGESAVSGMLKTTR